MLQLHLKKAFTGGTSGRERACQCKRLRVAASVPELRDLLEEGKATHSSILAWRIPMDRAAWQATVLGVAKGQTRLSN